MTRRITTQILENAVQDLNEMLGLAITQYAEDANGKVIRDQNGWLTTNAGTFYIGGAYGGYRLERMCKGGGAMDISDRGTKREVLDTINAIKTGIRLARGEI